MALTTTRAALESRPLVGSIDHIRVRVRVRVRVIQRSNDREQGLR